ncbi:MAG: FKBP-type peptidyl-prolyl cis-trans isomerase [Phycisphaerae bacterium]|nr:FKBP-type peptidyl-prolyl cis-trans isomerase [Phycisphaerae bacterium]
MIIEVELLEVSSPPTIPETPEGEYVINTSGLKYHDIKVGEGESPTETSRVKIHFTGWLEDGTVIDSTILHDMPQDIPLAAPGVIKGWLEGIITMKVGGKRKLVIPPDMAYGKRGRPGVPPESTVIYEIELLEIIKP